MLRLNFRLVAGVLCLGLATLLGSSSVMFAQSEKVPNKLDRYKEKLKALEGDYRNTLTDAIKSAVELEKKNGEELKKLQDDYAKEKDTAKKAALKTALDKASKNQAQIHESRKAFDRQLGEISKVFVAPKVEKKPEKLEDRLGAVVTAPIAILIDQLNLASGQGKVVVSAPAKTLAAKIGLMTNDILLKVDSKAVPTDPNAYLQVVGNIKTDAAVQVTVLRHGKSQTLSSATVVPPAPKVVPKTVPAPKTAPKTDATPKTAPKTDAVPKKGEAKNLKFDNMVGEINQGGKITFKALEGKITKAELTKANPKVTVTSSADSITISTANDVAIGERIRVIVTGQGDNKATLKVNVKAK